MLPHETPFERNAKKHHPQSSTPNKNQKKGMELQGKGRKNIFYMDVATKNRFEAIDPDRQKVTAATRQNDTNLFIFFTFRTIPIFFFYFFFVVCAVCLDCREHWHV
jgi:hypothetical protein